MIKILLQTLLFCNLFSYTTSGQCNLQKPKNLAVNTITSCSATLSWSPVTGAAYYQIRYKLGTNAWNYINTGTTSSWQITNLLASKNYSFSVASFCVNDSTKGYGNQLKMKTLACSAPEAVSVSGITKHKAGIQWQPVCNGTLFNLQYRPLGNINWTIVSNIAASSIQLTGLATGTTYELQLQTNCGTAASAFTAIQTFTTTGIAPAVKPNILAIMVDDGRYDIYQPNGGPSWFETPAINRIADEGVNFQVTCPATSQCGPSRATFYTGLYPHNNGCIINGNSITDSLPLIQELLQEQGYFTGFVGKYGQGFGNPKGFDYWAVSISDDHKDVIYSINNKDTFIAGHISDIYPQFALEFLNQVPTGQPFALFYFHRAPHGPSVPRPEDALLYTNDPIPFPSNFDKYDHDYPSFYYTSVYKWPYDSIETIEARLLEYQTVAGVEDNTDTLMDWLESKNIIDNTFIMYTSDNGYLRGEHLLQGKGLAQEQSLRLPLFIRYPKWFSAGTVINNQIAANIDIAPTFLELAGIPDTYGMDGVSLHQLATGAVSRTEFFYEFGGTGNIIPPLRAIRSLQYKYTNYYCNNITEEFFDLENDPLENNNLIADPSYTQLIQTYRDKLDSFRVELGDYEPVPISCFLSNPTFEKTVLTDQEVDQPFSELTITPNPATQFFTIKYNSRSSMKSGNVTVTNVLGEPVFTKQLGVESNISFLIDCALWPAGVYMLTLKTGDTLIAERMLVVD